MKRNMLTVLAGTMLICSMTLAGCGSAASGAAATATASAAASTAASTESAPASATPEAPKEQVTIKFGVEKVDEKLVAVFEEKNPDIKIEQVTVGSESEKLMSMLAAGTAPDLIRLTGAIALPGYVIKGIALNLDEYFAKSEVFKADDMLAICNVYRFDGMKAGSGSIYGLPKDWSNDTGIFANKKAFELAGVPVPSTEKPMTYQELYALNKQLVKFDDKGKTTMVGCNSLSGVLSYQTLLYQLATLGKTLWSDDMKTSRWTDADVKAIVQMEIDARKDKSLNSPLREEGNVLFNMDNMAMENWGYWATGMYRPDEKFKDRLTDVICVPSPYMEGGTPAAACTFATGGIINARTKYPDQAFRVFEWYFGQEPAEDRARGGWGLPVLKHLMDLVPSETDFDKQVNQVISRELDSLVTITPNPYLSGNYENVIAKFLEPVLFDKVTLDDALAQLKQETDTLITEGMEIAGIY